MATVRKRGDRWQVIVQVLDRYGVAAVGVKAFVFGMPGGFVGSSALWRQWGRCSDAVGLPSHLTPHNLRHTYASTLLGAGMPLVKVAALLGHTPAVCASTYAHWIDDGGSEAADVIERSRRESR